MQKETVPKTVGIIAEYNPFHNGHLYQLQEAKRLSCAEFSVVIMSGSFVQRGTPAFLDKINRTRMALLNGADLVIELPVRYATASAEYFSIGAISLLHNLRIVDYICFGSESGNMNAMKKIAEYIQKDCDDFNNSIANLVKNGASYPEARQTALLEHCSSVDASTLNEIIASPNNILGIEYLKALTYLQSPIQPLTVRRVQTGYHELALQTGETENTINSATAIRSCLEKDMPLTTIQQSVPDSVYAVLKGLSTYPVTSLGLSDMLYYVLATKSIEELASYQDITLDLARTMKNNLHKYENYEQYINVLKTKQYTFTRISRCLLHILLDIQKYQLKGMNSQEIAPYARVLGFRKESSEILKRIKKEGTIPLITKMADAKDILTPSAYKMLCEDIFATDLYHRLIFQSFHTKGKNDIQTSPLIL